MNNSIDERVKEELRKRKLVKKRIKVMDSQYGTQTIDLEGYGIKNPTGYQIYKNFIEFYMDGKVPEKSDGKVKLIEKENVKVIIIKYFDYKKDVSFH